MDLKFAWMLGKSIGQNSLCCVPLRRLWSGAACLFTVINSQRMFYLQVFFNAYSEPQRELAVKQFYLIEAVPGIL
jgi:hypothetical protein